MSNRISSLSGCVLTVCVYLISVFPAFSQKPLPIDPVHLCSYDGSPIKGPLYEFAPSAATNQIVDHILLAVGLKPRFEVKAANVPNAAAMIYNNQRYILYSQQFVTQVNQATHTDWAAVSILAHEIGHHLNGHTLGLSGSRPSNELEADEFSGFVLRRMGATMMEAQAAMKALADEEATPTHPPKSARLEAIAVGWTRAGEKANASVIAKKYPDTTSQPEMAGNTGSAPMAPRSAPIHESQVLGKVVLDASPDKEYYLTREGQLVKIVEGTPQVVGKLSKSDDASFPFVIIGQNNRVMVLADTGILYNKNGERLGYVKEN